MGALGAEARARRQVWAVIGCGAASSVGCQGSSLAVEKEWVKAMCCGDSALLGRTNAGARGESRLQVLPGGTSPRCEGRRVHLHVLEGRGTIRVCN